MKFTRTVSANKFYVYARKSLCRVPTFFCLRNLIYILKGTHTHSLPFIHTHIYASKKVLYTFRTAGMVNIKLIYDFCGWNIKMLLPLERYNVYVRYNDV